MSIKLEFIADGYEGGPLLLLWGGVADDVSGLIRTFVSLSNLLEPFADDAHGGGFQHLNMSDGAEVIYSTRRAW